MWIHEPALRKKWSSGMEQTLSSGKNYVRNAGYNINTELFNWLMAEWIYVCMYAPTGCRNASFRRNTIIYLPNESHRFLLSTLSVCLFHPRVLSIIHCTTLVLKSQSRLDSSRICLTLILPRLIEGAACSQQYLMTYQQENRETFCKSSIQCWYYQHSSHRFH